MAHRRHDHKRHKQEDKWRDAHEADPFSAEHRAHGSLQALRDQVHGRYHDERHKERKRQPKDDRPTQGFPEGSIVTSKENMWVQVGEHPDKINIKTDC